MNEREKVVKGLECCHEGGRCGYYGGGPTCPYLKKDGEAGACVGRLIDDACALLKEQEPIKPTVAVDTWICSKCGHRLESQDLIDDKENPQVLVHELYQYCPNCGRAVKWENE